ncbi:transposase [Streptomyces mirabilis]
MAALTCFKAGERSRLIYHPCIRGRHRGDHRRFAWQDYRDLLVRAHLWLGGPVVVVWDNPNVHRCSRLRQYAAERNWLAIVQLPTLVPDLNPVAGIWSLLRCTTTAHVVFTDREHLVQAVRSGMRRIRRRSHLIDGYLAETGLSLDATTRRRGQ